jgi:hypothetical protein
MKVSASSLRTLSRQIGQMQDNFMQSADFNRLGLWNIALFN